ncbi:MAG: hypothetical protein JXQ96_11435 [Cyclobacteriaceae bacterium]
MRLQIKGLVFLLVIVALPNWSSAQVLDKFPTTVQPNMFIGNQFYLNLPNKNRFRHGALWYYPFKFKQEQVISVNQPYTGLDNVYYPNKKGETTYRSMAVTAPMNRYMNNRVYDSFNPTGARNIQEGIAQGMVNLIFNQW